MTRKKVGSMRTGMPATCNRGPRRHRPQGTAGPLPFAVVAEPPSRPVIRHLDGDLVIRRAEAADVDAVVALNVAVFGAPGRGRCPGPAHRAHSTWSGSWSWPVRAPSARAAARWPRRAPASRTPSSSTASVLQGSQIENVTTDARFRRRGLVRALFDAHHRRAAEDGELLQVIGGIPYFYRKLGYGYGFDVPAHHQHRCPPQPRTVDPDAGVDPPRRSRRRRMAARPWRPSIAGGSHRACAPGRCSRHGSPAPHRSTV